MIDASSRESHLEESGANLRFLQAVLAECELGNDSRVLDIGCGTGVLGSLVYAITGAEVIGTELSPSAAKIARQRITCLLRTDGSVPVESGPFDVVLCKDVLPMIRDRAEFFTAIRRALRPGGLFATYLPSAQDFGEKPLYRYLPGSLAASKRYYHPVSQNVRLLRNAGFAKVKVFRLYLGTVQLAGRYVQKHLDGFFSNSDRQSLQAPRLAGLERLRQGLETLTAHGLMLHYHWERRAVFAR